MKLKYLPLYVKILIGMAIGLILGLIATSTGLTSYVTDWIKPFGEIFMRLLKLIAIPLVLISLIKGIGGLKDISKFATMGVRTLVLYVCTTIVAIIIGIGLVLAIKPGEMVSKETSATMYKNYSQSVTSKMENLDDLEKQGPLQSIVDIFPSNAIQAMGDNSLMLQIILIAILVGASMLLVGEEKCAPFMNFINSLDAIVLKVIDLIMNYAPIGVASLMASLVADSAGDISLLGALGVYALTVILGLAIIMYGFYPLLVKLFTRINPKDFIRAVIPVQLVGFSTSSSAATLPTTMKVANNILKIPSSVTSFVLPIGVTINMDGTSCYQAISTIFIAQVMGVDLSFAQILIVIATTTLSSIGTPGIPGGSVVISMMVLSSIGIPPEGLALILGIDRPLDMIRTAVNVTGDVAVASIVSAKTVPTETVQ